MRNTQRNYYLLDIRDCRRAFWQD